MRPRDGAGGPLEQQLSAVSGLEQMNSNSNEGSTQIRLNFTWGHDLNEAMDDRRRWSILLASPEFQLK